MCSAIFMYWTTMRLLSNSPQPIMVVSSESMEPTFYRGDLILLWNRQRDVQVGDIPVVWFAGRPLPMVHRAIKVYYNQSSPTAEQLILTKGDNNLVDDTSIYPPGRPFIQQQDIIGLVRGYIPVMGLFALLAKEGPWVLYLSLAFLLVASIVL
ncbi:signal peptidase I [Massariosphaeria phaeospora]|uniref:Signal peptidase complex catalytic subunit SEC11 n=1 Tax=Massariosphaeria phaeospora TaxID=100035 RepID=A0A7C8M797_9PLEO|nr:signal peptidase I [Massariosphaeria phaeospora]